MQPDDRTRILHRIDAAEAAIQFVAGRGREDLDTDQMLPFALVRTIEVLGEAAARVSAETHSVQCGISI